MREGSDFKKIYLYTIMNIGFTVNINMASKNFFNKHSRKND